MVDWSHTTSPTVKRFITFLYRGDYEAPELLPKTSELEEISKLDAIPPRPAEIQVKLKRKHSSAFQGERSKTLFLPVLGDCLKLGSPSLTVDTAAGRFEERYELSTHDSGDFKYGDALQAHAEIYCFAHYHLVSDLEILALQRIEQVLLRIVDIDDNTVADLTAVMQFIYQNTDQRDGVQDPLRKLIAHFCALHYPELITGPFLQLVKDDGEFAVDLMRLVNQRPVASEELVETLQVELDDREDAVEKLTQSAKEKDVEISRLSEKTRDLRRRLKPE